MLCGELTPERAATLKDRQDESLDTVRHAAHFIGSLNEVKLPTGYYGSFVELHIEQGPILERENIPLGIVTAIAAPAALRVQIEGEGGHAGAVLMPQRRDAFLGAAEIALAVEAAAHATKAIDTVGTCGLVEVFPNLANGIPNRVKLELDIRDIDLARRDAVLQQSRASLPGYRRQTQLANHRDHTQRRRSRHLRSHRRRRSRECLSAQNLAYKRMVSRAYHDSLFMSRIAPTAMLFIPCKAGVSHRPDEYAAPEDMANGARVLARTLAALAS